jgi:hypothetical protein
LVERSSSRDGQIDLQGAILSPFVLLRANVQLDYASSLWYEYKKSIFILKIPLVADEFESVISKTHLG